MLELKRQGVAQIIISHRLIDIFVVGDRVMVLKRGENVGDRYVKHTTEHEVLDIIVSGTHETALNSRCGAHRPGGRRRYGPASRPSLDRDPPMLGQDDFGQDHARQLFLVVPAQAGIQ